MKNKKIIKIGIIGTGNISKIMIDAFRHTKKFEVTTLFSRSCEKAKKYSKAWKIKNYICDINKFSHKSVDLIYIGSVTKSHFKYCKILIHKGYNLLCEKQFVLNYKEAKFLFNYAKINKKIIFILHKTIYMPSMISLKKDFKHLLNIDNLHSVYISMFHVRDNIVKCEENNLYKPVEYLYDMYYYPLNAILYLFDTAEIQSISSDFIKSEFSSCSRVFINILISNIKIIMNIDYNLVTNKPSIFYFENHDIYVYRWSNMTKYEIYSKIENKIIKTVELNLNQEYLYYVYELEYFYKNYTNNDIDIFYNQNKIDIKSVKYTEKIENNNFVS